MSRIVILVCMMFLFSSGTAISASPMVEAFKEYQAALNVGDINKADEAGQRAWDLAEAAGKTKTAAVLAYNLAELRLRYLPDADAVAPARRVAEIKESGVELSISQEKIAIALALSEYNQKFSGKALRSLKLAVKAYKLSEQPSTYSVFSAQMNLIENAINRNQWRRVNGLSIDAQKSFKENELSSTSLLIDLKLLQIASIVTFDEELKADVYQQIFQDIYDLHGLLPADKPNKSYYKFQAWRAAVNSFLDRSKRNSGEVVKLTYRDSDDAEVDLCPEFVWDKRTPPRYPLRSLIEGYVGAAVIVYNLTEDGKTKNISVGAEVPSRAFGEYAVAAAKKWRGHFVSKPSGACLAKEKYVVYPVH